MRHALAVAVFLLGFILFAGRLTYLHMQSLPHIQLAAQERAAVTAAYHNEVYQRVKQYADAFTRRDFQTMYDMSLFRGVKRPTLLEYRNSRATAENFAMNVTIQDVEITGNQATVHLLLTLFHPAIGTNKSYHKQLWERVDDQWLKIEYGI